VSTIEHRRPVRDSQTLLRSGGMTTYPLYS
jgi:hypothetical protein